MNDRNKILEQITPCCGLPYDVMVFLIQNSIPEGATQTAILNLLSHTGGLTNREWNLFIDAISLIEGSLVTKEGLRGLLKCCGSKCDFIKSFIENVDLIGWVPPEEGDYLAPQSDTEIFE